MSCTAQQRGISGTLCKMLRNKSLYETAKKTIAAREPGPKKSKLSQTPLVLCLKANAHPPKQKVREILLFS